MATRCINKLGNPEQYQRLQEHFKFPDGVLDAKIGVWQEQHNTDEFPTIEQMELYEKNRPKDTKVKPIASYSDEMNEIRAKAIADGTFMKAPNGNPTNLKERQWLQVRTKTFKDWFGDWESVAARIANAKVIWGHPGIGKTEYYKNNNNVIDFDSVYKPRINKELGLPEGAEERKKWRREHRDEYRQKILSLFDEAVEDAKKQGKQLLVSDMVVLQEREEALDLITQMSEDTFAKRSAQRNEPYDDNKKLWKTDIDESIAKVSDKSKVVNTEKYLSELYEDSKDVSKVVDENGEPLVVYHGSNEKFTEFRNDVPIYTSNNIELTTTYVEDKFFDDSLNDNYTEFDELKDIRYIAEELEFAGYADEQHPIGKNLSNFIKTHKDLSDDWSGSYIYENSATIIRNEYFNEFKEALYLDKLEENNYKLFNNIKNPLIIDADYQAWNKIPFEGDIVSTRQIEQIARDRGYDGFIVKNVVDLGESSSDIQRFEGVNGTIFVAFNPNQIKSATGNVGTFSPRDSNIYKSEDFAKRLKTSIESWTVELQELIDANPNKAEAIVAEFNKNHFNINFGVYNGRVTDKSLKIDGISIDNPKAILQHFKDKAKRGKIYEIIFNTVYLSEIEDTIGKSPNSYLKSVYNSILNKFIVENKITPSFEYNTSIDSSMAFQWREGNPVIYINPTNLRAELLLSDNPSERYTELVIHELTHGLMSSLLELSEQDVQQLSPEAQKCYNDIYDLYNSIKDKLPESYGKTSVHEFVSEALSNRKFQLELAKIKYDSNKSLFDRFIEGFLQAVSRYLGIDTKNSALESVFQITSNFIHTKDSIELINWLSNNSSVYNSQVLNGTISKEFYTEVGVEDYIADLVADGIKREDIKVVHTPVNEEKNEDEYWTVSYTTQQTTTQQQTNITNMEEKINESVETPQEEPQTVTPLEEVSDDARHQMYRTWNAKTIAARALRIAKMFSDEVTDIEMKLPMGEKQLSSFDTRTYIITKGVGAQKIFERIKQRIADTYANPEWARQTLSEVYDDIESHPEEFQKKVDYMVQQGNYMLEFFEPLCLEANNEIKQNESTSIFSKDGDVISVAEEEIEEFEEAVSKHDEGWANKVHERSAEETLDREIRLLLANIYELDDEGYYTRLDDLEEPVPYGFGYVHSTLLNIVSKVTSDVAMMPTLKKNVAKFPWIQQVINLIGGQDTSNVTIYAGLSEAERKAKALSLQALFWKGMHKIHVNIATQTLETENEGGEAKIVSRIVNSPEGEEAALRGYENVCYTSKTLYDNGNPYKHVYNPDGTFNTEVYNDMWTLWNNSTIKQKMFKWDSSYVPTQEDLETLTTVLRAFGIDTPLANIYDLINPSDDSIVRQEQAEKIVALNSALSTGFYNAQQGNNNPLKRVSSKETPENIFDAFNVQYRAIARVFGDSIMGYEESSARFKLDNEDKKLYSHIFPNHISTIFNKLSNVDRVSEDEYKERLQKTYLSNWWFTSPNGRHIRNGWLRDCLNNPKLRRGIRLKSLKASMGRGYASEINAQAEITRLNEFFHGNHAIGKINFREYSVPAFSDTSENYFCRGRYYNIADAEQHNELLNNLADVLKQEMERRNVVIRRYQLIKEDLEAGRVPRIKPIAGWDVSFKVEDGKLIPNLDKPNGTQFFFFPSINAREFSKEYNSLPVENREEFIRSQVEKALNEEFQFYLKQFNEYGISQIPRSDYTIDIAGRAALVSNLKAQIVGTSSRLSKIENSLSKEAMTEDTFRSLLAQWKEEAIKIYPQLNTTAVDAIMANYNFSKDQVLISKLQDFFENSFYANSQIIELTMRDPAFLGTPDKFQKRFKQFYSPVSTCYTCHYMVDENGDLELLDPDAPDSLVKTTEVSITLAEANLKPALSIDNIRAAIKAQYAKGRITRDQAIEIEKSLGELGSGIDIADAQCYRTLPSWEKCLNMIGKGSNLKVQQAIERLEKGEWSYEDYNIVWQVFKPFVSSYYEVPSHLPEAEQFPQYTNISVPTQHKNSEFLLLAIYSKLSGVLQDSYKLKGLNKFMVDHGIDKAQFESAVKVGNQGSIDLKDCTTEEEVIATLEAATGLHGNMQADKEGNPDVLHRMPFSDWGISTAMPEHLLEHEKSSMGTQIMKIIMEDMPEEGCMINGVRKTRAQWLELYQAIFTQNLKEAFAEVDDTLTTTKKLAEYLKKQIYSQNKYSQDLIDHLEIGPDGNFKNPIIDPMLRSQFDSLCASLIRKEVTKRPFRMGALPQVASWGFEDKIQLRFQDNSGNLIYTKEEFEEKLKDEHVVTITVGDAVLSFHTWEQYQDYAKTNATRIKYMEVLLPLFDNNFSRNIQDAFIDKETGKFNHKLFNEKLSDKMKEALGYRVPSEAKHSMIPLYVKGFLPAQNSSCIVIPPEWIAISDSDNDGDKLYTLFYESEVVYDDARIRADFLADGGNVSDAVQNTKKFQAYARRKKADPNYIKEIKRKEFETVQLDRIEGETDSQYQQRCDLASITSNGAAARNNKLLEMMNAVLQTEDNTQFILTPGGFPVIKRVTDKIKDLLGVTSDTASICNPAMRTIHQIRNMAGANLIPVYANYRALRPLMQLADLKLHPRCQVVINGNYSLPKDSKGYPTWSLSAYRNAVGEYITDNISNFLGCAVDNAKDPRLSFSGQSLLTAPISMMMINMGYTIEETALFMMQPAVRDLVREYYLNNEEVQLKDLIANRVKEYTHNGTYTPECAYPNLTDLPNQLMEDQIKKDAAGVVPTESDDAVQLQVLNVLQKLLIASDALNNINAVTRANTQNGAASSESSRNKQRLLTISRMQTEVKRSDFPITGAEALVPTIDKFNQDEDIKNSKIPMNAAFRFYGIDQIPEMFKHISLTFNALVDTVHRAALNLTDKPTLSISTIDGLTNAVASYTLSSIDAFNRTNSYTGYRATVMKLFPSILASIKRDNLIPDNMLINDLVANVTGNVYSKSLPFITLPKSTKRNQGAITNYRRAWESLYENGDTEIKVKWNNQIIPLTYRDVANFLLSYCFFTNGMNAGGNSFISCFPKGRIPEIEGYVNALQSLERGTLTDTQTILDQYVANHPEDSTFTTRISVADFNKAIRTEKGIPTRIIVDTINSQDNKTLETFTVKDTVSKVRKAHPYIFVTDGKGVRYLYKGYSYDDRVVYYRCEVLGNTSSKYLEEYQKGKSIAYERADGIKSIIPSNNPNTILTSEVSTGIEAKRSTGQGVTLDDVRTIVSNLLSPDATKASVKVQDFNEQTNDLTGVEFCVII